MELPLFPMNLVAFPGEELNLHISDTQYRELIKDCIGAKCSFGISSYVAHRIEYGIEAHVVDVVKTYDNQDMDIRVKGSRIFRVREFINPMKGKPYAMGRVEYIEQTQNSDDRLNVEILHLAMELFEWLEVADEMVLNPDTVLYEIIHKIGLKLEEEYLMLSMDSELVRQQYVINHLCKLIPALKRVEAARQKIRMNGHFVDIDPIKF